MSDLTPSTIDLIGTWRLVSITEWTDGELTNPQALYAEPVGYIHYLADGRVAVLLAQGSRPPLDGTQVTASEHERATAFTSFSAYAGTYERDGDTVVHHLDMHSHPNDVGADYIRHIELDGDRLVLCTLPFTRSDGRRRVTKLTWERVAAFAGSCPRR